MSSSSVPIIVLAHGSRHPRADGAISLIADATSALSGVDVYAAHLDFSPATLTNVVQLLAAKGHREAVVVPLLFTKAFHARHDVPEALQEAQEATGVHLHLADGLGSGEDMAQVVARANRTVARGAERLVLYSVGSSMPEANRAVADLARRVGEILQLPDAVAVHATGKGEGTGPQASLDAAGESGVIVPLFVAPGTLWDAVVEHVSLYGGPRLGGPLVTAVAPLVLKRAGGADFRGECFGAETGL